MFHAICLFSNVGEQSHNSCALDSDCEFSLVLCACACSSSGRDLASLCDELAKFSCIFVIDNSVLFSTECAYFFSGPLIHARSLCVSVFHCNFSLNLERELFLVHQDTAHFGCEEVFFRRCGRNS